MKKLTVEIVCDRCNVSSRMKRDSIREANKAARDAGWNSGSVDYCPTCLPDVIAEATTEKAAEDARQQRRRARERLQALKETARVLDDYANTQSNKVPVTISREEALERATPSLRR